MVSGYLSGVAVIIAVGQLPKVLGLRKDVSLWQGLLSPLLWDPTRRAVALVTIAAMAGAPAAITRRIPAAILGLVAGAVAYLVLALFDADLFRLAANPRVIGPIEASGSIIDAVRSRATLLAGVTPVDIGIIFVSALTLSVLFSIDTLKTGVVLDVLARHRHDSNRELIGQGAANAVSFLVGGMPGAGTMGATLVNFTSGGRSLWSGVAEGAFVVAAFVLLGGLIA